MTFIKFLQKMCKDKGVSITDVMHFLEGDKVSVDIPMSLQKIYDIDVNNNIYARFVCYEIISFMQCDNSLEKLKTELEIKFFFSGLYKETVDPCTLNVFSIPVYNLAYFYDDFNDTIRREDICMSSGGVDCPFRKKEMDERTPEENTMEITIKTNPDQEKEKELASLLQSIEL